MCARAWGMGRGEAIVRAEERGSRIDNRRRQKQTHRLIHRLVHGPDGQLRQAGFDAVQHGGVSGARADAKGCRAARLSFSSLPLSLLTPETFPTLASRCASKSIRVRACRSFLRRQEAPATRGARPMATPDAVGAFEWPVFYGYPPYFTCVYGGRTRRGGRGTPLQLPPRPNPRCHNRAPLSKHNSLQPVAETRARQSELWRSLILAYCRHHKVT